MHYNGCNYLYIMGLKLIHVKKGAPEGNLHADMHAAMI